MERNEVFYDWLRAKLFEVEDNKEREEWLLASVKELAALLAEDLHEVRCYTLVALDANIPADNSCIVAAYEIVKKHWTSVEGKYSEAPRGILRGVILSALYQLGTGDGEICRVIYYTASAYAQFVQFGSEQKVVDRILREFGRNVEAEAMAEWSLASEPTVPKIDTFKLKGFKLGTVSVEVTSLKTSLEKAIGTNESGHASYQQNQSYNNSWAAHFASDASTSIANAIQKSVQDLGASLSAESLETEINKFFNSVRTSLTSTFKASFQSLVAVEQRSKLLWWKETLYSMTLGKGYRELDATVLPVVMAIDLAAMLPDVTPVSVDYLLKDTYRAVVGNKTDEKTLAELLASFGEEVVQKLLAPHLPLMTDCGERTTLTAFLAQVVHERRQPKKLTTDTGLRATEKATAAELAVLVLHDLLTERLIQNAHVS